MLRERLIIFTFSAMVAAFATLPAQQGRRGGAETPAVKPVKGNLYQVSGGGANAFFIVGADEVLVIDAKMTADAVQKMLAEIRKVSDKPVKRVLLTHSDGDHVGGLAGFPEPVTIIASRGAKQEIEQANASGTNKVPVPGETFTESKTIALGDTKIQLLHLGPAHTSGDVVVYLPAEKAAIAGDLIFIGRDPLIHTAKGGTSFGYVAALQELLKLDAETYLSGHAEAVDKGAIEALCQRIEETQAKVKAMVKEGKTLEEVKAAIDPAGAAKAGGGRRWPSLAEIVYREVTAEPGQAK